MSSLKHYGVKGMKWGVRKDDATSTNRKAKSREAKTLSNEELQQRIRRIELESRYVNLSSKPTQLEKGQKIAGEILLNVGKQAASDLVRTGVKKGTKAGTKLVVKKVTGK